jgi:hypothetical protein
MMWRIYTLWLRNMIRAINLHLLCWMSKTTQLPTLSQLRQVCFTSAKFLQSAFLAILCHETKEAFHSLCCSAASRIFLGLITHN